MNKKIVLFAAVLASTDCSAGIFEVLKFSQAKVRLALFFQALGVRLGKTVTSFVVDETDSDDCLAIACNYEIDLSTSGDSDDDYGF
jgi:hypothetical protein